MASNGMIPMFNGENYRSWSMKMKTLLKSEELWDVVEHGYAEHGCSTLLQENRKTDAKALLFILQALDEDVFPTIEVATSSKEAWGILSREYLSDNKKINLQMGAPERTDASSSGGQISSIFLKAANVGMLAFHIATGDFSGAVDTVSNLFSSE